MPFLIRDYQAYTMADDYTSFVKHLVWYRMYCACGVSRSKKDYQEGFDKLIDSFERVFQYEDDGVPYGIQQIVNPYFTSISKILKKPNLEDDDVDKIADLLLDLEKVEDARQNSLRERCLDFRLNADIKQNLPDQLYDSLKYLLDIEENDAIIVESFKYLDGVLRTVLNDSSSENFGENLINKVFAPQTGYLQLDTHVNEQVGMRNFFSGANAIFRNPSAHRSQFSGKDALFLGAGQEFSIVVVELVGLMTIIVRNLLYQKIAPSVWSSLERVCVENYLSKERNSFHTSWWEMSKSPEELDKNASEYRFRVSLNFDKDDVSLRIWSHDSIDRNIVVNLKQYLEAQTGLLVKMSTK